MSEAPISMPAEGEVVKKRRGCLFYGSLGCLGVMIFVGGVIAFTFWKVMDSVSPHEIEPVVFSAQEKKVFESKVETLRRGKGGVVSPVQTNLQNEPELSPVTFSGREVSSLLSNLELGNHLFQVRFAQDRIQVLGNLPIPDELPGLETEGGSFSKVLSSLPMGQQIPFHAEVKINLRGGRPYLQLLSAEMMGLPLEALTGNQWQKEIDILSKFGGQAPILETLFGHLQQLQFDEKGLHLTPR